MDTMLTTSLWQQFGATIDMLDHAISLCPDQLWTAVLWKDPDEIEGGQFWFVAYHTLFWLDLYLTGSSDGFAPPTPFIRGKLPEKPYTKDQIRGYLDQCRRKCQSTLEALTDEKARQRCKFDWLEASFLELQLYNMRHVQEHAAQLNLLLGQHDVSGLDWVTQARTKAT
jgi:DinB superfamily